MLIWMCALKCEAKPVLDRHRLRKSDQATPYPVYHGDDMACVVSGIGALSMARAMTWALHNLGSDRTERAWINLGIAGHASLDIGTLVVAESFRTAGQPAMIHPDPPLTSGLARRPLISVPSPQTSYPVGAMIDMEGWAFATAASGSGETNRRQGLKIISDNSSTPPTLDKSAISALIEANMNDIDEFASTLVAQAHWENE